MIRCRCRLMPTGHSCLNRCETAEAIVEHRYRSGNYKHVPIMDTASVTIVALEQKPGT